jgi:hypothetical protein
VSPIESPNFVDPLAKDVVKYDTDDDIINCCAVILPVTIKLPFIY